MSANPSAIRMTARLAAPVNFSLSSGAIEALKWFALVSMTVDHVNSYLFHQSSAFVLAFGRLAFPIFAFVLGYNLARALVPDLGRYARRMVLPGLIAQPFYTLMIGMPWRLNIFFTFLAALALIALARQPATRRRDIAIAAVFLIAGFVVDFYWYGIALVVASYYFCRLKNVGAGIALACAIGGYVMFLAMVIGLPAIFTLFAVPLVWYAQRLSPRLKRQRC